MISAWLAVQGLEVLLSGMQCCSRLLQTRLPHAACLVPHAMDHTCTCRQAAEGRSWHITADGPHLNFYSTASTATPGAQAPADVHTSGLDTSRPPASRGLPNGSHASAHSPSLNPAHQHPAGAVQPGSGSQPAAAPTAAKPRPSSRSPRPQRTLCKTHSPQTGAAAPGSTEFPHMVDPGACKVAFKVLELPVPLPAEDFRLEYRLYDKYQRRVHGDKQTVKSRAALARCYGTRQGRGMKLCTEHMQGLCCLPHQLLLCCACASSGTCCTLCRSECLAAVTSDGNLQCGYQEHAIKSLTVCHVCLQTASGFRRFLVESPISRDAPAAASTQPPPGGYGTFHQQYWLNGEALGHARTPLHAMLCSTWAASPAKRLFACSAPIAATG